MLLPAAFRGISLRSALIGIILLALLPTLSITAMSLVSAGKSQQDISAQQLLEAAHILAQSTISEIEMMQRLLRVMSETGSGIGEGGLEAVAERMGGSHAIYSVHRNGDILNVPGASLDPEIRSAVQAAARGGEAQVTNFLIAGARQRPSRIAIAIPIAKGASADRVAVITAPSNRMIRGLLRDLGSDTAVVLAITDGNGRIISRSVEGERMVGRPVPDWDELDGSGKESGWFRARRLEGQGVIFAFQRIEGTPGWAAVVGEPAETFDARWRTPITAMIVAAAITALAALGVAFVLTHRFLRPIKALAARAHQIANSVDDPGAGVGASFVTEFEALRLSLDAAETAMRRSLAESRSAEHALRESYATLSHAERAARIGSWSLDLATEEFNSSPMLLEMIGYPAGYRLRLRELRHLFDPETFRRLEGAIRTCARVGTPYAMELLHLRTDGGMFAAWVQGQAVRDETGAIIRIVGILQDISLRKEQADLLMLLADNLPSGVIFRLDHVAGKLPGMTYVSAGIERLIGLSPETIIADPEVLVRAIEPEDRRGLYRAFLRHAAFGDVVDRVFRMHTRTGRVIWVRMRAGLRLAPGGRPVWDGIAMDVTAAREAEIALRAAKEAAESAEQAKSSFLATMSHELRTPMNTLIGMSRLALRTDLQPKQRDYLEKINTAANVLLELINDVLDYSKIEAGRLELEGTVFRLETMLETVSSVSALRAEEKGLEITFSIAADTPQVVRGDPLRLGQVLTNLVGNAVKFTERGDVVVLVKPLPTARGARLLFEVRDTGIGLTRDQIRGLFRPFTQASADVSRRYGGTGLGLAICRQLVELMGGEIWLESTPGVGSSFYFTVALEPVAETEAPAGLALPTGGLLGRRVLVVDDNASSRIALAEMLESFGMGVRTAADGSAALRLLRQEGLAGAHFDIILVDWQMPEMGRRGIRGTAFRNGEHAADACGAYGDGLWPACRYRGEAGAVRRFAKAGHAVDDVQHDLVGAVGGRAAGARADHHHGEGSCRAPDPCR